MLKYRELLNELQKLSEEQLDEYIIVSADDQHQIGCELIIADDDLYKHGKWKRRGIEESSVEYIDGFPKERWLEKNKTFPK